MDVNAILGTRLFGYAVLFRARADGAGGYTPVASSAQDEAVELARELQLLRGESVGDGTCDPDEVGISVPFGRCGVAGRPLEHVRLLHVEAAWVDVLSGDGLQTRAVGEGETILVEPGRIVRFRARPRRGGRVLVAFQTEDRSPLHGHAAPLTRADDVVPGDAVGRLAVTSGALQALAADPGAAQARLQELWTAMADSVAAAPAAAAAQAAADSAGSYAAGGDGALFDAARALLTPVVVDRVRQGDETLFRFPGMFGAVAPLFPLLEAPTA